MYYVGETLDKDNGGYKTIQQAKKQAAKKGLKVFDEDGTQVYPEAPDLTQEDAKQEQAEENTTEETKAATEAHSDAQEETNGSGQTQEEHSEPEKTGAVSAAEIDKLQHKAGAVFDAAAAGTVTVVRDGMIALRNAPKWEAGHKCGVAKTGYTARTVGRFDTPDGSFYKLETGRYISAKEGDTEFKADKD